MNYINYICPEECDNLVNCSNCPNRIHYKTTYKFKHKKIALIVEDTELVEGCTMFLSDSKDYFDIINNFILILDDLSWNFTIVLSTKDQQLIDSIKKTIGNVIKENGNRMEVNYEYLWEVANNKG